MFEKLVIDNPMIPVKFHDAIINEASSSIIEVLKGQMESGKLKDMVKYFQFPGIYHNPLITSTVNKFANKLNNYYAIEPAVALDVANALIPKVMQEMIKQSKTEQSSDFALGTLLSNLSGNLTANMNALLDQLAVA